MSINCQKINNSNFFYIIILTLLFLLFLHLYKQNLIVGMQYKIQTTKIKKQILEKKNQDLKKELIKLKNHDSIAKKAKKLGLEKINIKQIERL